MPNDETPKGRVIQMRPATPEEIANLPATVVALESLVISTTDDPAEQAGLVIASGEQFKLTILTRLPPGLLALKKDVDDLLELTAPSVCTGCNGAKLLPSGELCEGCGGKGEIAFAFEDAKAYETWLKNQQKLRALAKDTNEARLKLTRPIDDLKKVAMDAVRPIPDGIEIIEARIVAASKNWRDNERKKQEDADKAAQERLRAGAIKSGETKAAQLELAGQPAAAAQVREQAATRPLPAPRTTPIIPEVKGTKFEWVWKYAIEDPTAIPDEYKIPSQIDEAAIAARVKNYGLQHGIAGVAAWQEEEQVRVSTRGVKR